MKMILAALLAMVLVYQPVWAKEEAMQRIIGTLIVLAVPVLAMAVGVPWMAVALATGAFFAPELQPISAAPARPIEATALPRSTERRPTLVPSLLQ